MRLSNGSMCTATCSLYRCAAWITAGSRLSVGEPQPHQLITTSSTPAFAMSRICLAIRRGSLDEYAPRIGKYAE